MRQLTENEQRIVEKIVQLKQSARLEELQVARLLRKELECFALRWILEPKKTLFFYSCQDESTTDINKSILSRYKHYRLRSRLTKKELYMIEANLSIMLPWTYFGVKKALFRI